MPDVEVSDSGISFGIFNKRTKFKEDVKLFPAKGGKPNFTDVRQGYTDLDCYFLASVVAVLKQSPEKIIDCFPEYKNLSESEINEKFKNDKKIKIRFFKVKRIRNKYIPNGTVDIVVDKTALRSKGVAWVRLLEKAYAVYKAKKCDGEGEEIPDEKFAGKKIKSRIIDGIYGGDSGSAIVTLTGKASTTEYLGTDNERSKFKKFSRYCAEAINLYHRIEEYLRQKKVVTASASRGNRIYRKGLFFRHVYTVIGTEERGGYKYVIVRNPYANRSRKYVQDSEGNYHSETVISASDDEKGVSRLELNDFYKNFESIEVGN